MKDLKLLLNISKKFISNIWYILLAILLFSLLISFLTILQPLLFASMVNALMPSFDFENLLNIKNTQSVENFKLFNLNLIGEKFFLFITNNIFGEKLTALQFFYIAIPIFLILVTLIAVIDFIAKALLHYANTKLILNFRKNLFSKLLDLDYAYYKIISSGDVISRLVQDTRRASSNILPIYSTFFTNFLLLLFYFTFLVSTNLYITVVSLAIIFVQFIIVYLLRNIIKKIYTNFVNSSAKTLSLLTEVFSSIKVIKIFQNKTFHQNNTEELMEKERKNEFLSKSLDDGLEQLTKIISAITTVVIIFLLYKELSSGKMSVEGALMYLVIGRLMLTPTLRFINIYTDVLMVAATYKKIDYYQNLPNQIVEGNSNIISFKKNIKINKLNFTYDNKDFFTFDDLTINKYDKIGFIGTNGSGKTTLIDLILRLLKPLSGNIVIDDKDIKEFTIKTYNSLFGVVPQDPYLFNDSIKNNIIFGRKNISDEQIDKVIKISKANDFIEIKNKGLNYIIGEKGTNLSGGEKQKIAIARALLTDPEIIIFDEAMSSVDNRNMKFINENFNKIFEDKTMIIIGHSFSALSICNKFVKIDGGKIQTIIESKEEIEKKNIIQNLLGS